MIVGESKFRKGMIGLYMEDEFGQVEETITLTKKNANKLAKDLKKKLSH